jgi:hypothetical protein
MMLSLGILLKVARNLSTSEIGFGIQGDSNSFEGEFEPEERRSDGAPDVCAPKATHVELSQTK